MKVILTQDVKDQGKKGDLITVSDGYARNYLLAKKLAVEADAKALNEIKNREAALKHKAAMEKQNAIETAAKLETLIVIINNPASAEGRLYGTVTSMDVSEALKTQFGIDIDKRKIQINEHIKHFGTYIIDVKLHADVAGKITINVTDNK